MLHIAAGVGLGIFVGVMLLNSWASWTTRRQVRRQMRAWRTPEPPRPLYQRAAGWVAYTVIGVTVVVVIATVV